MHLTTSLVTQQPNASQDKDVADSMRPIGNTFLLYADETHPDLSTVCFCMNTADSGGNLTGGIHTTPANFDTNWITPDEQCNGKLIYSLHSFLQTLVLEPFYDNYAPTIYNSVAASVTLQNPSPSYETVSTTTTPNSITYTPYNVQDGNDQFYNTYTVTWTNFPQRVNLHFAGQIKFEKTKTTDMGLLGTAKAWAGGSQDWICDLDITCTYDENTGEPKLSMNSPSFNITPATTYSDKNTLGKIFGDLGVVFGPLLDLFHLDGGVLTMVANLPSSGLQGIAATFQATKTSFILPAGNIFIFKVCQEHQILRAFIYNC